MSTLLETLYQALPPATELPQGTYDGKTDTLAGFAWQGKVFTGDRVRNRLGPFEVIEGTVRLNLNGEVEIFYPSLNLHDLLRPVSPGVYLGWTQPRTLKIWFLLSKVKP